MNTEINTEQNKRMFKEIVEKAIKRDGIRSLMGWVEGKTDFFTAPASSKYHLACEGGLCLHSLNVYNRLLQQVTAVFGQEYVAENEEKLAIIALFHDLCKANFYAVDYRNTKTATGEWVKVPYYTTREKFRYGAHGAKSVFLIMKWMQLTDEEAVCIQNHMGAYDHAPNDSAFSSAMEAYPLALLLHFADELATKLDEKNG